MTVRHSAVPQNRSVDNVQTRIWSKVTCNPAPVEQPLHSFDNERRGGEGHRQEEDYGKDNTRRYEVSEAWVVASVDGLLELERRTRLKQYSNSDAPVGNSIILGRPLPEWEYPLASGCCCILTVDSERSLDRRIANLYSAWDQFVDL